MPLNTGVVSRRVRRQTLKEEFAERWCGGHRPQYQRMPNIPRTWSSLANHTEGSMKDAQE